MTKYRISFEYMDDFSKGKWNEQECVLYASTRAEAIKKCLELYGLGYDCEYRILSVIAVD